MCPDVVLFGCRPSIDEREEVMRTSLHNIQNMSDLKALMDSIGWEKLRPVVPVIVRIVMAVQFFLPKRNHSSEHVQV